MIAECDKVELFAERGKGEQKWRTGLNQNGYGLRDSVQFCTILYGTINGSVLLRAKIWP